jgi:abequosyltransferase
LQWCEELEICVADNASSDDTAEIVKSFSAKLGSVKYFCWDINQGADRNFLKSVDIASGDYCWILGSDDPIAPKAISTILKTLTVEGPSIVLFNRMLCTREMQILREDRFLKVGVAARRTFDFAKPGELENYLESARSICATFSYLSSMVFKKSDWDAVSDYEQFVGSAYVHSYKLLVLCERGAKLEYVNDPLVLCRLGNDSFRELGIAKRVLIDLDGYVRLAQTCFSNRRPRCSAALLAVLRYEYPLTRILRYQGVLGADPLWPTIVKRLSTDVGHSRLAIALATFLGRSRLIVNFSFMLRDLLSKRK